MAPRGMTAASPKGGRDGGGATIGASDAAGEGRALKEPAWRDVLVAWCGAVRKGGGSGMTPGLRSSQLGGRDCLFRRHGALGGTQNMSSKGKMGLYGGMGKPSPSGRRGIHEHVQGPEAQAPLRPFCRDGATTGLIKDRGRPWRGAPWHLMAGEGTEKSNSYAGGKSGGRWAAIASAPRGLTPTARPLSSGEQSPQAG